MCIGVITLINAITLMALRISVITLINAVTLMALRISDIFLSLQYVIVTCAKFGSTYLGKGQPPQEKRYPFIPVWVVFICVQTMVWLPLFGIYNMHINDVCVWLHTRAVRTPSESALKADSGRKTLAAPGTRTRVSVAPGFSVGRSTN